VQLEKLLAGLQWRGPLSLDAILTDEGPSVIDINPRLLEPMNAHWAGVDLVGVALDLARNRHPPTQGPGRPGVRSCQLLLAISGAAKTTDSRIGVAREMVSALRHRGCYAHAIEESTPTKDDPIACVPVVAAACATILRPRSWRSFHAGAAGPYSLTADAWQQILGLRACAGAPESA